MYVEFAQPIAGGRTSQPAASEPAVGGMLGLSVAVDAWVAIPASVRPPAGL